MDIVRIEGYEDYGADIFGNIYSFRVNSNGRKISRTGDKDGYLRVSLIDKDNNTKTFFTHRIIASTFLKDQMSDEKNTVNHKDGNKLNNCVDNLEWMSRTDNVLHSIYELKTRYKPVSLYIEGVLVKTYESIKQASIDTGIDSSGISKTCKGKQKYAGTINGKCCIWRYSSSTTIESTESEASRVGLSDPKHEGV